MEVSERIQCDSSHSRQYHNEKEMKGNKSFLTYVTLLHNSIPSKFGIAQNYCKPNITCGASV